MAKDKAEELTLVEVNERLDELILDFFRVYDDLMHSQTLLNDNMKNGFLTMSRTRYSMGVKSVGQMQFDENNMTALFKVKVHSGENHDKKDLFSLSDIPSELSTDSKDIESSSVEQPAVETIGLRKRNIQADDTKTDNQDDNNISEKITSKADNRKAKNSRMDPLKWFGVLVPSSLRQSQTSFKNAIEQTVTVANLKKDLTKLRNDYTSLLLKKKELMTN